MIVNPSDNNMAKDTPQDSPPSYDIATEDGSSYGSPKPPHMGDSKSQPLPLIPELAGPSYTAYNVQPLMTPSPTVYNYVNPQTGEQVVSLLPPDHPEMVCLQAGEHIPHTHYGILGILAAVFWFPLGVGLCLLDRRVKCQRCGLMIENGMCN